MPNLNENARRLWDRTTSLMASDEAKATFLKQVDKNQDGKVTGAEIRELADDDHDGYLNSDEIERLSLKAQAYDFDKTTIKAMAQAANQTPQLSLFEAEAPPKAPEPVIIQEPAQESPEAVEDTTAPAQTAAAEPQAEELPKWNASTQLQQLNESHRTTIAYRPEALPSRDLKALKAVKPGLFRVQDQVGNSCGTTSLSMTLKFWQGHTLENSVETIDKYIRAQGKIELALPGGQKKSFDIDGYTAARDIVDYAKTQGMRAGLKNNASISEIKSYLDKGVPVMVLTDWNFKGGSWEAPADAQPDAKSVHWVDIIGYEYEKNPKTQQQELYLKIGNPHGVVQKVSEEDFKKIWSNIKLQVGKNTVDTGMNRILIAMVPRDDEHKIVAPNGTVYTAGQISVPDGNDGLTGWMAQKGSELLHKAAAFQDNLAQRGGQLSAEMAAGYDEAGILGAINNLWNGNENEIAQLRAIAQRGGPETKAKIINELLEKSVNRANIQQLAFEILKETSWGKDFDSLLEKLDTRKLASRLQDDKQAGQVLAWIAKSEVDRAGKTGPKFQGFATELAIHHRHLAIREFLKEPNVVKQKLMQAVPASLVRDAVKKLMEGITGSGEEAAISDMLKATSWAQLDQVLAGLNVRSLAAELENDQQLGELTGRILQIGARTSNWGHMGEVLNHLSVLSQFTRADNVLGVALTQEGSKEALEKMPKHLRTRTLDLLDDRLRLRTPEALKALETLKKLK